MFELRDYQKEAIAAVAEARARGVRRMVICLPTGAGKTVIFSRLAANADRGVLVLAHRDELLSQAADKLQRTMGEGAKVGIEQGNRRADKDCDVVVASIRSLHEGRIGQAMAGRDIGLVIYDECHHAPAEGNTKVLEQLGCFEPDWPGTLVGFTATTARGDGVGLEKVFEEIVATRSIAQMIDDGYLVRLRGYRINSGADLRKLTSAKNSDFDAGELGEAIDIQERNALVARSIQELARDRRTLVFCVTVAHARALCRALNGIGVPAGMVHGEMKKDTRATVLKNFREGMFQALTNVGVLTEGFDDPGVSCVAMARPTKSQSLYAQCVGRGTRLAPGKTDCLVLDFVDLSQVALVTLPSLLGMPRQMNLNGEDALEVSEQMRQFWLEHPTYEMDPGEVTLSEIKLRAEQFDPVTREVDAEIRAISPYDWVSLGRAGVALHYFKPNGRLGEFLVLRQPAPGQRKLWVVRRDGDEVARFATMEEAVEAADYELGKLGPVSTDSAHPRAAWRSSTVTPEIRQALRELKPPRRANTLGEAMHYIVYDMHAPRGSLIE